MCLSTNELELAQRAYLHQLQHSNGLERACNPAGKVSPEEVTNPSLLFRFLLDVRQSYVDVLRSLRIENLILEWEGQTDIEFGSEIYHR